MGAQGQDLAFLAQPGGARLGGIGFLGKAVGGFPILALHRLTQQAA